MRENQEKIQFKEGVCQSNFWNKIYIEFDDDDIQNDEDIHAVVEYHNVMIRARNANCRNGTMEDEIDEAAFRNEYKKRRYDKQENIRLLEFRKENGCYKCMLYAKPRECFAKWKCPLTEEQKYQFGVKERPIYCPIGDKLNCVYRQTTNQCFNDVCMQHLIKRNQ